MTKHSVFLAVLGLCASGAPAQDAPGNPLAYTDAAPYTDILPAVAPGRAPSHWKGSLSRAQVLQALREARADGTLPVGESANYPFDARPVPVAVREVAATPGAAMGAPAAIAAAPQDGLTLDGYRFVGGEAGYVFVSRGLR